MGSQLSHTRLPFQKKWTTPIQPFDPDYFKKLDEKLKAEKKEKKSAVKSSTKSAKRKQEDQKPVAAPKPVQFFQPAKWWLGTELDDKTTKEDEQKPVTVFTSPLISSPLLPDDNSLPKPPSGPGIPDYRLFILPGQAELSDEEVQEILQQDVKPHVPTNPDDVVTVTLPDLDKPILTMPWKKSKKEEHQLPLEKVLKKSKPSKSTSPVLPLDEELFDTPEPVLQDFEEPDVKFGRYENRCPTRGGLRFELVFEDEEEHLLAPKPNLDVENPKRKRKELKKELKKKQTAAEARRKQHQDNIRKKMQEQAMIRKNKIEELNKKKMQEQAALDKFMNVLLKKDASDHARKNQLSTLNQCMHYNMLSSEKLILPCYITL